MLPRIHSHDCDCHACRPDLPNGGTALDRLLAAAAAACVAAMIVTFFI